MKRIVGMVIAMFFLAAVVCFAPCRSYAFNPQPEPPGKEQKIIKPGDTKAGITIEEKKKKQQQKKGTGQQEGGAS
jgi:hypothetical protein